MSPPCHVPTGAPAGPAVPIAGALMHSSLARRRNVFPSTYTFTCRGKHTRAPFVPLCTALWRTPPAPPGPPLTPW